ncbi:hypothetical protein ACFFMN_23570 [Planobispora siamensis]|uniref:Uncharacterized protein n=1 Tax=Planobispora siamensis TaxID=936338 RepID=A0A8J3WLI8_9ACTN|nr:hypothetical protein [Planobispora siamensis]GIH95344.1 hypothetical protein Psi01_59740 [Planobispora siamensis]
MADDLRSRNAQTGLTPDELDALSLTADLAGRLALIVGEGRSRAHDLNELLVHVHAIQHAVMAQAAARIYPERFRLLGEEINHA